VKKLASRISELEAAKAQYNAELQQLNKVMAEMEGNIARALKIR